MMIWCILTELLERKFQEKMLMSPYVSTFCELWVPITLSGSIMSDHHGSNSVRSSCFLENFWSAFNVLLVCAIWFLTLQPTAFWDFASYGGGGGVLFGPDPENKVNGLIWNMVLIILRMILVNMQNLKLLFILLLEIWRHKKSFPEWNESLRFDIYPLESSKTREKNIFPGTNFHAFPWFWSKTKKFVCLIFRDVSFKKKTAATPWWIDFAKILPKCV